MNSLSIYKTLPIVQLVRCIHHRLPVKDIFEELVSGNRSALATAITLAESTCNEKRSKAVALLDLAMNCERQRILASPKISFRIGITGAPGSGKSTVIETLGRKLTCEGHKVAVLAVDPSSAKTGGSLLGDRTRMTELARDPNAYIRPSPACGTLGGVTRSTNEAIVLCEAAGYNIILVETVGVGQSELAVADMVDMFVLIIPPAAGDELQGIKKGIVEMADLILINKADGELLPAARKIQAEYTSALRLLRPSRSGWRPRVTPVSALHNEGFDNAWMLMQQYYEGLVEGDFLKLKRKDQHLKWMWNYIRDHIMDYFCQNAIVRQNLPNIESLVRDGKIAPSIAADQLIRSFLSQEAVGSS